MNIIITGASRGIGYAIASTFAAQSEKHCIGICSRNANELEAAESELRKISAVHEYFSRICDVSQEYQVNEFVADFEKRYGAVDGLINNAGFGIFKSVTDLTKQDFESVFAANVRGVFLMTRAALPKMRQRKSGTVITISSLAGKNGFKGGAAYCASKYAVRGLMQCLFLEVRSDNIRFVTIFPGSVDTAFFTSNENASEIKSKNALMAQDVASCVELAMRLPLRADISEIDIRPTNPKG